MDSDVLLPSLRNYKIREASKTFVIYFISLKVELIQGIGEEKQAFCNLSG